MCSKTQITQSVRYVIPTSLLVGMMKKGSPVLDKIYQKCYKMTNSAKPLTLHATFQIIANFTNGNMTAWIIKGHNLIRIIIMFLVISDLIAEHKFPWKTRH